MRLFFILLIFFNIKTAFAQPTPYEKSSNQASATYTEAIRYYQKLAAKFPKQAKLITQGETDFGKPLHVFVLSKNGVFDAAALKKNDKRVLLINNGIHPGEPEGIDASMMLARDLLNRATDSFFNWNFFDSILARKEHFSAYVFEDTASHLLRENPDLKQKLDLEKAKDTTFAKSAQAQLNFIYKNSAYSEPTFMRYPVGRIETDLKLDLK